MDPEIDAVDLARRLDSDSPPFLLDVREPWEWSISGLKQKGACLIPLAELPRRLGELPTGRAVVVYCRSGQRSFTAARQLILEGHTEVSNLRGGILAWARDIDPDMVVV